MKAAYPFVFVLCISQPLAASADSPSNQTAMSENPCPPALEIPHALAEASAATLTPKAARVNAEALAADPEMQAYAKSQRERAQSDWANLCRYRQANAEISSPTRVVFMGNSITEGWARSDPEFFKQGIVDRGISGQTSPQMLLRFFQDVIELHPKLVHMMAGTNDVAGNTGPTSVKDFQNNVRAMVELAQAHHIRIALASILPASSFPWRPAYRPAQTIERLNAWLKQYAQETHSRYIDYYAVLNDGQGGFKSDLSNDGVHPNRDGYAAMKKLAEDGIK